MWARCLPDPPLAARAAVLRREDPRAAAGLALALAVALFAAMAAVMVAALPAGAQQAGRGTARLDVVTTEGDTVPVVREITITRDGIRMEPAGKVTVRQVRTRPHARVNVEIDGEDTTRHIVIDTHPRSGEIVSMFQDVEVPAGRVVNGEVVAIFGSVKVHGTVESDVVAVMGSVDLGDSARVGGDVVAVGGTVHAPPGAEIQGESVSVPLFGPPRLMPWLPLVGGAISLGLFLLLGVIVSALFPERLVRVAATVSRRTFLSLVIGAATFPLLPILVLLLIITVIGIPVAALLLFLYPVAALVGYIASCALIGARFRRRPASDSLMPSALLGIAFVGIFFLVGGALTSMPGGGPLHVLGLVLLGVGAVIGSVSALLGLGALLLSRLGEPERGEPAGTESAGGAAAAPGDPFAGSSYQGAPPPAS